MNQNNGVNPPFNSYYQNNYQPYASNSYINNKTNLKYTKNDLASY